jgi:ribosomal protein S18 acetylase RimI-like enzyme
VRPELERALAFLAALEQRASTRVERYRFGRAHFHDRLPRVWDRNFLLVESDPPETEALVEDAERLQGGAGFYHRSIHFDEEELGRRHAPDLERRGFSIRRVLVMAQLREPGERPSATAVEVDHADLRTARKAYLRSEPFGRDPETARQLLANEDVLADATSERCFAVRAGREVVSYCRLYSDGSTFQVEDVATLPSHRGRGYASTVVATAAGAAREDGAHLVFLTAFDDEPAQDLYRRLGFEPVGATLEAIRAAVALR